MMGPASDLPLCALCGRPMLPGSANFHHLVPKSLGGRETVQLHRICHDKIHATLSERDLARDYPTIKALLSHPEIRRFVTWIKRRPAGFMGSNRRSKR